VLLPDLTYGEVGVQEVVGTYRSTKSLAVMDKFAKIIEEKNKGLLLLSVKQLNYQ